jgi:uncharacterized protein YndB with AHSA1/START domain
MTERKRSIDLQVEVPGTPEEVWDAIATGPGISVWFVPTDVEEREGGTITMHHGEGMDETGVVTAWDKPRRFAFESDFQPTETASRERLALELLVEARSGDTCVVRLVHSGFGSGADWDNMLEGNEAGWRMCLRTLQLYLTHFPGLPSKRIHVMGTAPGTKEQAWGAFAGELGVRDAAVGDRIAPDAPGFAGIVERVDDEMVTLRLDEPAPGIGIVAAGGPADVTFTQVAAVLFGDEAEAIAAREQSAWQAWMNEHFPLPEDTRLGVG